MKITIFNFTLILLYSIGYVQSQTSGEVNEVIDTLSSAQNNLIRDVISKLPSQSQLAIAIIENGKTKFHGVEKRNDSIHTIQNQEHLFEIGSISKVFTATLLADFVLNQRLALDANINDYLDFQIKDDAKITFGQLATHTSGFPRIPASLAFASLENPYKDYSEEKLIHYLKNDLSILSEPGTVCEYSNLGAAVLGYFLSIIDTSSYEEMLQTKIFSKYDMLHSTSERSSIDHSFVTGLNDQGVQVSNWDMAAFAGAGAVISSVEDLSKFAIAQFDSINTELALTRQNHFTVNDAYSMGLGWSLITADTGSIWNWHNGGTGGYSSSIIIDTKAQHGVIVLSNISALGKLSAQILNLTPELLKTLY